MQNTTSQTPVGATNPSRKVTRAELAVILNVSERYIDNLVSRHVIPVLRLGRRCVRFDVPQVEEALSKYTVNAA